MISGHLLLMAYDQITEKERENRCLKYKMCLKYSQGLL